MQLAVAQPPCSLCCRLGVGDRYLERHLAAAGCEVHCFEPGLRQPHVQQADMWLHRLSVDWRDPNPAAGGQQQHAVTKKLATILNDFGHRQVRLTPRASAPAASFSFVINGDKIYWPASQRLISKWNIFHTLQIQTIT